MEYSRQEFWSGLPFPSPGNIPDPGIKPLSPVLAGGFFTTESPGKPREDFRKSLFQIKKKKKNKRIRRGGGAGRRGGCFQNAKTLSPASSPQEDK